MDFLQLFDMIGIAHLTQWLGLLPLCRLSMNCKQMYRAVFESKGEWKRRELCLVSLINDGTHIMNFVEAQLYIHILLHAPILKSANMPKVYQPCHCYNLQPILTAMTQGPTKVSVGLCNFCLSFSLIVKNVCVSYSFSISILMPGSAAMTWLWTLVIGW